MNINLAEDLLLYINEKIYGKYFLHFMTIPLLKYSYTPLFKNINEKFE